MILRRIAVPLLAAAALATANPAAANAEDNLDGVDPLLTFMYQWAERDAHAVGVPLSITSAARSWQEQDQLWQEGIATYGGPDQARRWVLPPHESTHVNGHAIDVGPIEGAAWLDANGYRYGLCRTYDNEWWHFEFTSFPFLPCPPRWPDATARFHG